MALSEQEKQIVQYGKENGKSRMQVKAAVSRFRREQESRALAQQDKQVANDSAIADIPSDIRETVSGVKNAISSGRQSARDTVDTIAEGKVSPLAGTLKTIGTGLSTGARAIGEGVSGLLKLPFSQNTEDKAGAVVDKATDAVAQNDFVQGAMERYDNLSPENKAIVDGVVGTAEGLSTMLGAGPVNRSARRALSDVSNTVKDTTSKAVSSTGNAVKKITPNRISEISKKLKPANQKQATDALKKSYESAFVEDKSGVSNQLDKIARRASTKENRFTKQDLTDELAADGYLPQVEGKLANMNDVIDDLEARRTNIVEQEITPVLNNIDESFSLDDIKRRTVERLRNDGKGSSLQKSLAENDRIFDSFKEKYGGDKITANELNDIRLEMNENTKAFNKEDFEQDTSNIIGTVVREDIDRVAPEITDANNKLSDLFRKEETARQLNNKAINVGIFGDTLGRYGGAVAIGATGLATGNASLVIAGLGAQLGGDAVANFFRRRKFRPELKDKIRNAINEQPELKKQIIGSASKDNRTFIRDTLKASAGVSGSASLSGDNEPN